ncbi:MAG: hypothetical protein K6T61_03950 [Bryobacteraceae bacterium]|nr:hypothetical protein [Bryobacteraceae bacterium]
MKLVCPHCGHDGTPDTARTALGSYGFNYLADDVVCRDVEFDSETGRVRLSAGIKAGGAGANPRLECRACWQTFPAPEGIEFEIAPAPPTALPENQPSSTSREEGEAVPPPAEALSERFRRLAEGLSDFVRVCADEALSGVAQRLESMELRAEKWDGLAEAVAELRSQAAERAQQALTLTEELQSVRARLASIESALAAQAESVPQLADQLREMAARQEGAEARAGELRAAIENLSNRISESQAAIQSWQQAWQARLEGLENSLQHLTGAVQILSQLQQNQQSLQARLDKQAEAIRSLHAAAHERLQRREELQAALQRLEQIAGALGETKPLPEDL